jgi:hypothetical protein
MLLLVSAHMVRGRYPAFHASRSLRPSSGYAAVADEPDNHYLTPFLHLNALQHSGPGTEISPTTVASRGELCRAGPARQVVGERQDGSKYDCNNSNMKIEGSRGDDNTTEEERGGRSRCKIS